MDGTRALLVALLVLNGAQAVVALAAAGHGIRRRRAGVDHLARYSFGHALLLVAGAAALSIVPALGLAGVLATRTAAIVAVGSELAGVLAGRAILRRLHLRAHGSPGAAPASATPATSTAAERAAEASDA